MSNKKIIVNTFYLYAKVIISAGLVLYTTRLLLKALGVDDFGVFNLILGVVSLLAFLNGAMTTASQRYFSFFLGKNNNDKLKSVFYSSTLLHLIVSIIILILLFSVSNYLFAHVFNIPQNSILTAKKVYIVTVFIIFITINTVPYEAAIISHEDFLFDAIITVIFTVLKFFSAYILLYVNSDRLYLYSIFLLISTFLYSISKAIYSLSKYSECQFNNFRIEKSLFIEMTNFAGWNIFGAISGMVKNQGMSFILNIFLGVVANAAYGVANQINGQLIVFSNNMVRAVRPQIIKNEGEGNRQKMLMLSLQTCKYSFALLALLSLPIMFNINFILNIWLVKTPENTALFSVFVIISTLISLLTVGLQSSVQSIGKIKWYQIIVGGIQILNIPISIILLKYHFNLKFVLTSMVFLEVLASISRIFFTKYLADLSINVYIKEVLLKLFIPVVLTILWNLLLTNRLMQGWYNLIFMLITSSIIFIVSFGIWGLNKNEKTLIQNRVFKK